MTQNISWNIEEDAILIDFVRRHEMIYNVRCNNYRKTHLKNKVWQQVGAILKKTDFDCSKRWVYIRDYYIRRRGKAGTGSSGEAAKKRADLLTFLDNCSRRRSYKLLNSSTNNTIIGERTETKQDRTEETETEDDPMAIKVENVVDLEETSLQNAESRLLWTEEYDLQEADNSQFASQHRSASSQSGEKVEQRSNDEEDETNLFFTAMAKIVKKLPPYERAELRLQIGTLVGNAELKYLSTHR